MKLFGFKPDDHAGKLSFYVMANDSGTAVTDVQKFINQARKRGVFLPHDCEGFGTDAYTMFQVNANVVLMNENPVR